VADADITCETCGWPIGPGEEVVLALERAGTGGIAAFRRRHWTDGDPRWERLRSGFVQLPGRPGQPADGRDEPGSTSR
jgi:hypothetical protein